MRVWIFSTLYKPLFCLLGFAALRARLYINRRDWKLFSNFHCIGFCCMRSITRILSEYQKKMFYFVCSVSDSDCFNSIPLWVSVCLLRFQREETASVILSESFIHLTCMNVNLIRWAYEIRLDIGGEYLFWPNFI